MSALDGITRSWPAADAGGLPVACLICGANKGPCKWICLECSPSWSEGHTRVIEAWKARPESTAAAQAAVSPEVELLRERARAIDGLLERAEKLFEWFRGATTYFDADAEAWLSDYRRLRGGK